MLSLSSWRGEKQAPKEHQIDKKQAKEIDALQRKHKDEVDEIIKDFTRERQDLQARFNHDFQRESKKSEEKIQDLRQQLELQGRELRQVKNDLATEQGLRASASQHHAQELQSLRTSQEKEIDECRRRMQSQTTRHKKEQDQLQQRFRAEKETLHSEHEAEKVVHKQQQEELRQKFRAETEILCSKHKDEKDNLKKQMEDLITSYKMQVQDLTEWFRGNISDLNDALLARDDDAYLPANLATSDLVHFSDKIIKARFSEVAQLVEVLGRLEWKKDQKIWTREVLSGLGAHDNLRIVKKNILQDGIWTILNEQIFGSAFRMFGEEGEALDQQWNEQCGQELEPGDMVYIWPPPGIRTERWRYMTLRECRKALTEPVSELDPRAKLKEDFVLHTDHVLEQLNSFLDEMVGQNSETESMIKVLAKKSANTWLEFGMHRCRIMLSEQPEPLSAGEKAKRATTSPLQLTITPGLRRFGNAKGVELETVTQLEIGKTVSYPSDGGVVPRESSWDD